jgi:predicted aspartyl protease
MIQNLDEEDRASVVTELLDFLEGSKLAAAVKTLGINTMYITRHRNLEIQLDFLTYMGKAEEIALIDSGATENCIDYRTVAKLRLGTQKLSKPRPIINVDGTRNSGGIVEHCVHLYVSQGQKEERLKFFVTNLGKDQIILGYPWLEAFNPDINWGEGQIKGPKIQFKTTAYASKERIEAAINAQWTILEDV